MNYKGRVPEKICVLSGIVRNKGGGAGPFLFALYYELYFLSKIDSISSKMPLF